MDTQFLASASDISSLIKALWESPEMIAIVSAVSAFIAANIGKWIFSLVQKIKLNNKLTIDNLNAKRIAQAKEDEFTAYKKAEDAKIEAMNLKYTKALIEVKSAVLGKIASNKKEEEKEIDKSTTKLAEANKAMKKNLDIEDILK